MKMCSVRHLLSHGLVLLMGALAFIGCTPFQARVPAFSLKPTRLTVVPVIAVSSTLGFSDRVTVDPTRTKSIQTRANAELEGWAKRRGASMLSDEKVAGCEGPCTLLLARYLDWIVTSSVEIAGQQSGRNYGRSSVSDWRATHDYRPVQEALGADAVLVVVMRDLRETSGRVIGKFFLGSTTHFKQVVVACIATLGEHPQVEWCKSDVDRWPDLSEVPNAHMALSHVLLEL